MVARAATAGALGRKVKVAVLQPFLKRLPRRPQGPEQDQLRPTATLGEATSKLEEAVALVNTLGCEVVFKEVVALRSVHPKFLFGSGKAAEMSGVVSAADADAVFVNAPLSGQQQKALAAKWGGANVLDRFRVILDIFADRARTNEAKLQVELAELKYRAAHLVKGADSGYDRQRGGLGAVGGSGEKAIETQRRQLRDRTAEVNRQLKGVERRRGFQRGARDRRLEPTVALVGYTNVGKSSLLNQLALARHSRAAGSGEGDEAEEESEFGEQAGGGGGGGGARGGRPGFSGVGKGKGMVQAKNRVFDTLDPTVRSVTLPSRASCVLVDTVGFIQDLPTDLIHSFKSTLEEVKSADVLVHVRDASVEPRICEAQRKAVQETLAELGAGGVPTLEVWNKVDKERAVAAGGVGEEGRGGELIGDMSLWEEAEGGDGSGHAIARGGGFADATDGNRGSGSTGADGESQQQKGRRDGGQETLPTRETGPDDNDAVRVSASTGQGLALLLEKLDAMLHLDSGGGGGGRKFYAKPVDQYQYVRVLPGQSQLGHRR